jgi:EpsI family protein
MTRRLLLVAMLLLATSGYLARKSIAEPTLVRQPLSELPMQIGNWSGRAESPLEPKILSVLGVEDYARRTYFSRNEPGWVSLYIGYYASQRQGDTVHSPLNCLPGAGWTPITQDRTTLTVKDATGASASRQITVNRFVIQKGLERQLVLYWYQSQGRVIASEYWGRIFTVTDAIRRNRTDAALVRVIVPVLDDAPDATGAAEARAVGFVENMFPYLGRYLPS